MGVTAGTVQAGVKSVQRGQIWSGTNTAGTQPEMKYLDITISAVNTAKSRVEINALIGGGSSGSAASTAAQTADAYQSAANVQGRVFGYLLNSTTVRIYGGISNTALQWSGRWEVVEDY